MTEAASSQRPQFGNWIRARILVMHLAAGVALTVGGLLIGEPWLRVVVWAVGVVPLGIGVFLTYLFVMFADEGGGVQRRLWDVVLDALAWDGAGEALDVGTGQGALAVGLALRWSEARVTGVDLWGADWAYSKDACERNAEALGVGDRVQFAQASAAALPFADGTMDAVVSHFVFHEVKDGGGPLGALAEAVRVLKPGGAFAVQDMFFDARVYGDADGLVEKLRAMGLDDVRVVRLSERLRIPWGMGGRRVLGCAGLVTGVKA
jgi:SAM-dependent methyltransferase